MVTADGMLRRGKVVDMKSMADEALTNVPSVKHVIVVDRINNGDVHWVKDRDHWWHEFVPFQSATAKTEHTDAEDPLMIIYTSGTPVVRKVRCTPIADFP
ncbi:MAG: hypothetical protein R3C26_22830 [Calditrichia bacterium]